MKSLTALAPTHAAHARYGPKRQRSRIHGRLDDWPARVATAWLDAIAHAPIGRANAGMSGLHAMTTATRATVAPAEQWTTQNSPVTE